MLIDLTHREIPLECWANWRRDGGVRTLSQLGWMPSPTDTWTSSNAGLSVFNVDFISLLSLKVARFILSSK